IAITHLHADHIANIVEFIVQYRIPPGRVFVADAWFGHQELRALITEPRLVALGIGWGPTATLGSVNTGGGGATSRVAVSGPNVVDVLFSPSGMRAHQTAIDEEQRVRTRAAAGSATDADVRRAASRTSSTADAASLVYIVRNPLARTGVMYLQDMRGQTVT